MTAALPLAPPYAASRRQLRAFLVTNFVYVWLVFGWSLTLYPLGVDFVYLADSSGLPWATQRVFDMEMRLFGDTLWLWRSFNILLLYSCMVCILLLTRFVLDGPWWLGSLAAVLTMANPAKSEGVLHLSAVADLLPAFAALGALAAFACWRRHGGNILYGLSVLLLAFATFPFYQNLPLPLVVFLLYCIIPAGNATTMARLFPFALIGVIGLLRHSPQALEQGISIISAFAPLYLAFYPLGILSETAVMYERYPILWLLIALLFAFAIALAWRGSRQPALLFGVAGAIAMRLAPLPPFDLEHCKGGGALIVPIALLNLAAAAVWMQVQRHPRWKRAAVMLTTVLCFLFLGLQFQALWHWRQAAATVKAFQARAALSVEEAGGNEVAIAPDFRFHHTAPVALYASVLTDTAFSTQLPMRTALQTNYFPPGRGEVNILNWDSFGADIEISGCTLEELFGADFCTVQAGDDVDYDLFSLRVESREPGKVRVRIFTVDDFLPPTVVPLRNRGEGLALQLPEAAP